MLSRVADSIYWMSRYLERAENIARFIDVNLHLSLDLPDADSLAQWQPLISVMGDNEAFSERYGEATEESVIKFLTFDRENSNSMLSCLFAARENARSVREIISSEMWEQINRTYHMLRDADQTGRVWSDPAAFFEHFKKASHLFVGIADCTMTHGEGWNWGRLGRMLERADKTSRILDVKYFILLPHTEDVGTPFDTLQWAALLKSASAFEMYRKRFQRITPEQVAEYLILDREFPRAIHHCIIESEAALHAITGSSITSYSNRPEQQLGRLRAELAYADLDGIFATGLHEYLDQLQQKLNGIGHAVFETFFDAKPVDLAS